MAVFGSDVKWRLSPFVSRINFGMSINQHLRTVQPSVQSCHVQWRSVIAIFGVDTCIYKKNVNISTKLTYSDI